MIFVYSIQIIVLAILATRMHLHLWHTDRNLRGLGTDARFIPMSDISSPRTAPYGSLASSWSEVLKSTRYPFDVFIRFWLELRAEYARCQIWDPYGQLLFLLESRREREVHLDGSLFNIDRVSSFRCALQEMSDDSRCIGVTENGKGRLSLH